MDLPVNLPEKLYLLAYDPRRARTTQHSTLNLLLQAAALTELLRRGLLYEEGRKAVARVRTGAAEAGLDPYSAALLEQVKGARPRSWNAWIGRAKSAGRDQPVRRVRDGLADAGLITLRPHRVAGLFPVTLVTLDDPGAREALAAAVTRALTGPLSRVDPADAALTALVATGRLRSALSAGQRREYRGRIKKLAPAAGPVPRALTTALGRRMAGQAAEHAAMG
ncbi:GOLPH3/VPS74 family protein [Kitasatospora brasiliensis]|uniref:GOLPH3/VPS74 family protein n=1 Tax=Kitasatospora brasiliensis TaxID=3058040 RepID=UPI0029308920|nr:GPP34 family phosphoprotein [Kitasatospora sp. K002]